MTEEKSQSEEKAIELIDALKEKVDELHEQAHKDDNRSSQAA